MSVVFPSTNKMKSFLRSHELTQQDLHLKDSKLRKIVAKHFANKKYSPPDFNFPVSLILAQWKVDTQTFLKLDDTRKLIGDLTTMLLDCANPKLNKPVQQLERKLPEEEVPAVPKLKLELPEERGPVLRVMKQNRPIIQQTKPAGPKVYRNVKRRPSKCDKLSQFICGVFSRMG